MKNRSVPYEFKQASEMEGLIDQSDHLLPDDTVLERTKRQITDTLEQISDSLQDNADMIGAVSRVHDYLLQFKNFITVCNFAAGYTNLATAAKKMCQSLPVTLFDQSVARTIASTQIYTAAIQVFLASVVLINSVLEFENARQKQQHFPVWLRGKLDECCDLTLQLDESVRQTAASLKKLSEAQRTEVHDVLQDIENHLAEYQKTADELKDPDVYVNDIRRKIFTKNTDDSDEKNLFRGIRHFSHREKEYLYGLLRTSQLGRIKAQAEYDVTARLSVNLNEGNRTEVTSVVQTYYGSALMSGSEFRTGVEGVLAAPSAGLKALGENPDYRARESVLQMQSLQLVSRQKQRVALNVLNLVGAACLLTALLTGPAFPAAAVGLFIASIAVNLILIQRSKDYVGLTDTFYSVKKKITLGGARETLFHKRSAVFESEEQQSILSEKAREIMQMFESFPRRFRETFRNLLDDLKRLYDDIQKGKFEADGSDLAERILLIIKETPPAVGQDVKDALRNLYLAIPNAPALPDNIHSPRAF